MNTILHEMLFCEYMLVCESYDCRACFEFDEVACEPMDAWADRASVAAQACGWKVGHTGLVKCPKCTAAGA